MNRLSRMREEKLEVHLEAAMPCKKKSRSRELFQETLAVFGAPNKVPKTK